MVLARSSSTSSPAAGSLALSALVAVYSGYGPGACRAHGRRRWRHRPPRWYDRRGRNNGLWARVISPELKLDVRIVRVGITRTIRTRMNTRRNLLNTPPQLDADVKAFGEELDVERVGRTRKWRNRRNRCRESGLVKMSAS